MEFQSVENAWRANVKTILHLAVPDLKETLEKASRLIVVVRKHDYPFDFNERADTDKWVWVKAHGKIPVNKILDAYRNQCGVGDTDLVLSMADNTVPPGDTKMSELPQQDRMLVFAATTAPLLPPTQAAVNSSFGSAASQSPRPPLHPVSRQLTVPPSHSPVETKPSLTQLNQSGPANYFAHRNTETSPAVAGTVKPEQTENLNPSPQPAFAAAPLDSLDARPAAPIGHVASDANNGESAGEPLEYRPRSQGNPFAASQEEEADAAPRGRSLQQLSNETTPERLEAGVAAGLKTLAELEAPLLEMAGSEDAANWLKQIDIIRKDAARTRTVVGVVGNTGAGKSSVINAMLEEERLVPTNCMRACTAVVTELSYNDSTNPMMKYRAEIEFIQPADWQKELEILYKELFDDDGRLCREISNPDSDEGVAYAKIRAVYHKLTRDDLSRSSPEALMTHKHVRNVLGTTRRINESDAGAFYRRLQQFVDSKEKGTEKLDKNGNKAINQGKREFECWPLIKVVKIYTKAEALSTGAVIVDLPGVHDSNAARAAVAERYMQQCTGLWILAPINRAVDDKAAKNLLGDSFKRQLKFDGTYSSVTFICSKTDDISRTEASDSLGLDTAEIDHKLEELNSSRRELSKALKEAKASKSDYDSTIEDIEEQLEVWEELAEKVEDGKTVYEPPNKKRKRKSSETGASKRRRRAVQSDDESDNSRPKDAEAEDEPETDAGQPLTEEIVTKKLEELKQLKKDARREKRNLDERIEEIKEKLDDVQAEEDKVDAEHSALCIRGRNDYSRGAIQQDFAAGVKELDQENAAEEDPENFNPQEDIRDYEEVARRLPVFCVSSRAYQKLRGRLKKDSAVAGFTEPEQTEIPQLQAHCKKLTVAGRQASCRRFLNSITSFITSLSLWASDDGTGVKLTSQQRDAERTFLSRKLKDLEKALDKVVTETLEDVVDNLHEQLFEKLTPAVQAAVDNASSTASSWGAHRSAGGLHWGTYRATVRRDGVYSGAAGPRDFNGELTEPIYKQMATFWERAFQRRLPHILKTFKTSATNVLKQFHNAVETRTKDKGHGLARLAMLGTQLQAYSAVFGDLAASAVTMLNDGQREINREFTPAIASQMEPAYHACANESGRGSYMRMKASMTSHVDQEKTTMFDTAQQQVRQSLLALCETIKKEMLDKADGVFIQMQRDYLTLVGVNKGDVKMSREERNIRRKVDDALAGIDGHFEDILNADLEQLKASYAAEADVTAAEEDVEDEMAMTEEESSDDDGETGSVQEEDDEDDHKQNAVDDAVSDGSPSAVESPVSAAGSDGHAQ